MSLGASALAAARSQPSGASRKPLPCGEAEANGLLLRFAANLPVCIFSLNALFRAIFRLAIRGRHGRRHLASKPGSVTAMASKAAADTATRIDGFCTQGLGRADAST
jgi:hypothetical protein